MEYVYALLCLPFLILGVYGGMAAISRLLRGYQGFFILTPVGGSVYLVVMVVTSMLFFNSIRQMDGLLKLLLFAMMPFAMFGHVSWFAALVIELLARAAGPSDMPVTKTYDVGDGMMTRGKYDEAAEFFRQALAEDEVDIEALFRLARALELGGREQEAIRVLSEAHRCTLENRYDKELPKKERQERLLRISFALGDLYVKFDEMDRAKQLYAQSIEVLFGYVEAEALRERLKALEQPGRLSMPDAIRSSQPEVLPLDDEPSA